jgi:Flp pilus assembly protein TadD
VGSHRKFLQHRRAVGAAWLALCALAAAGCAGAPARRAADEAPALHSSEDARDRAIAARAQGDLDLALRLFVEAAEADPTDVDSLFAIGSIYDQREDKVRAARAYARVVQLDPAHSGALEGLGLCYFEDRQLEQARPLLTRAIAADRTLWRSHNALGLIADALGEHAVALTHFDAALALRPGTAAILNNRGYSSYLAGKFSDAERDFHAALTADSSYERAWHNSGLLHARRGEYESAVSVLSRVTSPHVAANDIGYIAMLNGDYAWAERLFADAMRLSPRYYATADENAAELRRRRAESGNR